MDERFDEDCVVEDPQAQLVYDAERAMWKRYRARMLPMTLAELARSANRVIDSRWWFARYGPQPWRIRCRSLPPSSPAEASAGAVGVIYFQRWRQNEYVLVHELAHYAAPCQEHHASLYCRAYLDIARFVLGDEPGRRLALEFQFHRVKVARRPAPALPSLVA